MRSSQVPQVFPVLIYCPFVLQILYFLLHNIYLRFTYFEDIFIITKYNP